MALSPSASAGLAKRVAPTFTSTSHLLNILAQVGVAPEDIQAGLGTTAKENTQTLIIDRLLRSALIDPDRLQLAVDYVARGGTAPTLFSGTAGKIKFTPATPTPAGPPTPTPTAPAGPPVSRVPTVPGGIPGGPGAPGTVTTQAGLAGLPRDVTITDVDELIRRTYGFSAFALDIPEVRSVLEQAAAGDWDDNRIVGAITNTGWWRKTSDSERQWTALESQDPATAQRQVQAQFESLRSQARTSGFTVDENRLGEIAKLSLRHGWSPQQVQRALASEFRFDPTGEKQTFATNLKRLANEYVVPLSEDNIERWGQRLLSGEFSEDDFQNYLIEQSKSMYPGLAASLDRGITVRQYADPYIQIASRTLEISDNDVDLLQGKWMRAINQIDPKTGERAVMSLGDWERTLKVDPAYGYDKTKGAREEAVALGTGLLRSFGAL